jgi:hypothetical protein
MADVEIEMLVESEPSEGEKSIFDAATRAVAPVRATTSQLSQTISQFCLSFSEGIEGAAKGLKDYRLETIEMNIELTAKGEVRLIASASSELKGGLKLVFGLKNKD